MACFSSRYIVFCIGSNSIVFLYAYYRNRDLPGIIEGAADGRGRGRQVISTARTCNLILIVLDASKPVTHKKIIEHELFSFGIRINQEVRGIGNYRQIPQLYISSPSFQLISILVWISHPM